MFELLQGRVVHDGMLSYANLPGQIHGYGMAHLLRELPAAIKQGEIGAQKMRQFLLGLDRFVRRRKRRAARDGNRGSPGIAEDLWSKIHRRYNEIWAMGVTYHEANPLVIFQ